MSAGTFCEKVSSSSDNCIMNFKRKNPRNVIVTHTKTHNDVLFCRYVNTTVTNRKAFPFVSVSALNTTTQK